MIVKFHARGVGRGSGPIDYLLGPQRDREGATLDRGDPGLIEALIDSSPYAKKYTSGVLSFQEADLPREDKDKLMDSFERALLPGLDRDQYQVGGTDRRDGQFLDLWRAINHDVIDIARNALDIAIERGAIEAGHRDRLRLVGRCPIACTALRVCIGEQDRMAEQLDSTAQVRGYRRFAGASFLVQYGDHFHGVASLDYLRKYVST